MTKNIMSIAAAAALLTSGAFAFETNTTGGLLNIDKVIGDYNTTNLPIVIFPEQSIDVDLDGLGDALIFQAFNQKDEWGTEIVVRNHQNYAVGAKFVAYSGIDSQELIDFNIYLSANDVFRCTIKDGKITTTDDSVNTGAGWGVLGTADGLPLTEETGYIAVYAMGAVPSITIHTPDAAAAGTQDPKETLRQVYYTALDMARPLWDKHEMQEGVFVTDVNNPIPMKSPKIMHNPGDQVAATRLCQGQRPVPNTKCPVEPVRYNITNPNEFTLSGTARIYNTDRDLLRPATALNNYSENGLDAEGNKDGDAFIMGWAPKELAAFADRNIVHLDDANYDTYGFAGVLQDSRDNAVSTTWYTFNNATVDASDSTDLQNKLVLTQPEKRTMIQMGQHGIFWQKTAQCKLTAADSGAEAWTVAQDRLENGSEWGLVYGATVWDEAEAKDTISQDPEVSPGGSAAKAVICYEVDEIANLEADTIMAEKNGYATVKFVRGAPAIISQMTASETSNGNREINWIDVPALPFVH